MFDLFCSAAFFSLCACITPLIKNTKVDHLREVV